VTIADFGGAQEHGVTFSSGDAGRAVHALAEIGGLIESGRFSLPVAQTYPSGEAPALGRLAALDADLPVEVAGAQLDRRCGSGLQAVIWVVMQVPTGVSLILVDDDLQRATPSVIRRSRAPVGYYSWDVPPSTASSDPVV
jgi:hypothetical protein